MVNWTDNTKANAEADILEAALRALRATLRPQPKPAPDPVEEPPHDHRLPNAGSLFVEKNVYYDDDGLLLWGEDK